MIAREEQRRFTFFVAKRFIFHPRGESSGKEREAVFVQQIKITAPSHMAKGNLNCIYMGWTIVTK